MPVILHLADGVATVVLDRPPLNVLDGGMRDDLRAAVRRVACRSDVRAVVVRGGRVFSTGADVEEMLSMTPAEARTHVHALQETFSAVARIPQPVIAAVQGYALGAGCELALCADVRIAADNAVLGQPEILLGVVPGAGGTQRLPRLIGPSRAKDLIFTGRFVRAHEALTIGLVDRVVPRRDLDALAQEWARRLALGGPVPTTGSAPRHGWSPRSPPGLPSHRSPSHPSKPAGVTMRSAPRAPLRPQSPRRAVVHAFPAQGDFALTPLIRALTTQDDLCRAFHEVTALSDPAAAEFGIRPLGPRLSGDAPPSLRHLFAEATGSPQYALYVSSLTIHRALAGRGPAPDHLVGMSFGDITACTAAGMFSVADGARVACHAARALGSRAGAMLLVESDGGDPDDLETLLRGIIDDGDPPDLALACVNDSDRVVLSGPEQTVATAARRLEARGLRTVPLKLPFLAHHPALGEAADAFAAAIRDIPVAPPLLPVHSSVLQRRYRDGEDVHEALAKGLTEPARLPVALRQAVGTGPALIVEAGTGSALTGSAARVLAGWDVVARTGLDVLLSAQDSAPQEAGHAD